MSSTESSGAPAEASATTPAPDAAFPSFGSTRGSGLARGKRPSTGPVAAASAATTEYTPTAIEVVSAPREYQNPFAPVNPEPVERVETPVAVTPQPVAAPAVAVAVTPVVESSAPVESEAAAVSESDEPAELNILEPAQQKVAPAQTWESEGFRPAREARNDRPRREEPRREERSERAPRQDSVPRQDSAPFDPASIPAKFLYVRPGYNYVPTPSNYGGAPRERSSSGPAASPAYSAPVAAAPEKSGGFLGWLKSLFGGSTPAPVAVETQAGEQRNGDRHRGGRGRGGPGGGDGQRRRSRGGRNRNRGEYRSGGDQGGSSGGSSAS